MKKAFTLIEILIVVILLGVLAAVIVPNLTGATEKTRAQTDMTNCKEIYKAAQAYLMENDAIENGVIPLEDLKTAKFLDSNITSPYSGKSYTITVDEGAITVKGGKDDHQWPKASGS